MALTATVQHLPATASPDDVAAALAADGCVVIDNLVDHDTIDAVLAEMAPHLDAAAPGPDAFTGLNTVRVGGLVARSETARGLVMEPTVLGTVGNVLGHATNHQLHLTQIIAIGPDSDAQPIHRDQWAFDFFPFPNGYEVQCNTIWAGTDFTEENGATRVIPGSNHFEDGLQHRLEDSIPAEMTKGSVLLYTGSLYHGGGPNRSDHTRYGINITYNLAWLRQEENQYLSVPPEIARELDVDLQRLIGYAQGAYALGYVDDLRDPLTVLNGQPSTNKGFGDGEAVAEIRAQAERVRSAAAPST